MPESAARTDPPTGPSRCPVGRVLARDTRASIGGVIVETDQALAAALKTKVFGGAPIGVAFDPPIGRAHV